MLFNDITSFIGNAHISFFSPSLLSSCFGNHLMEIILQLGLFLLHVHSSSRCPFDISNTRNSSKNGIILLVWVRKRLALAEIRPADLIHLVVIYYYVWKQTVWLPLSSPSQKKVEKISTPAGMWTQDRPLQMVLNWCSRPLSYGARFKQLKVCCMLYILTREQVLFLKNCAKHNYHRRLSNLTSNDINPSLDSSIGSASALYLGGPRFKTWQGWEYFNENK